MAASSAAALLSATPQAIASAIRNSGALRQLRSPPNPITNITINNGEAAMSLAGILIGLLNCVLLVAILVLLGAIVAWVASIFQWPIPWNIQQIYLLICLLVFIICVASLLLGAPMVHFFHASNLNAFSLAA